MPNTIEKLIELLKNIPQVNHAQAAVDGLDYVFGCTADYLIANGVTVQEWIPVTERKPDLELVEAQANDEELYKCLVTMKHRPSRGGRCVREMWYDGEGFVDRDYMDWTALITHWMPMPEPSKEG